MKLGMMLLFSMMLLGCEAPKLAGEQCHLVGARIEAQREALSNIELTNAPGTDKARIEWVISDQQALIDECMAAAVNVGPDCREFDQMGAVMDSKILLGSVVSLSDESGDSRLAFEFLRQARRALEVDSQYPRCLAD